MASASRLPSPNKFGSKNLTLVTLQLLKKFSTSVHSGLSVIFVLIKSLTRKLWYGVEAEEPKVIIHKASILRTVRKCAIHFAPIAATIVLAGLNIGTYFIGNEFVGNDTGYWQNVDRLALQITAKLYVGAQLASIAHDSQMPGRSKLTSAD